MINKAFQITFTFDQPQPGVITIPGEDADKAQANFLELMKEFANVKIVHVTDLETIPFLQGLYNRQMAGANGNDTFIEGEIVSVDEGEDLFKKPN